MIEQYVKGGDSKLDSPRPYALTLHHKHVPEMTAQSRLVVKPLFQPIVGNFLKGLAVTVPLHLSQLTAGASAESVHAALKAHYADERFVTVKPLRDSDAHTDGFFDVQACNDTNRVDIFVYANDEQVMLMSRLDNLGKGASGAAVQSMNIHWGIDEGRGL
jgi:N-acetyl-gamma-glutamyl-phosphate reductase